MSRKLLVCDLDNTLYDWVGYFVPAFYAMVDEVVRITNCDRERLLDDFRAVHQRHHDSEHPFSLLETRTVRELFPGKPDRDVAEHLNSAFYAFNVSRKQNLRLYQGVRETLDLLSASGLCLVAHTESKLYGVIDRLTRLELAPYFCRIYCRKRPESRHPHPETAREWLKRFPLQRIVELSHHQRKPDPDVLLEICRDQGIDPEDTAYVGDSIARDIFMARTAGVLAIWAKYGASPTRRDYERLVRISHWTAADVARERELNEITHGIEPDVVLSHDFAEIVRPLISASTS